MSIKTVLLGTFENESGSFTVSDPCYDVDVWCRGELKNVKRGFWHAKIKLIDEGEWGMRVSMLSVIHDSVLTTKLAQLKRVKAAFIVGVDSGQAGVFDSSHYRDDSLFPADARPLHDFGDNGEKWYGFCCDKTLSDEQAGIIPYGVVTSSGFGDGSYVCVYYTDQNNEVVRLELKFINSTTRSRSLFR